MAFVLIMIGCGCVLVRERRLRANGQTVVARALDRLAAAEGGSSFVEESDVAVERKKVRRLIELLTTYYLLLHTYYLLLITYYVLLTT